jgi:inner membrane protein
MDILTHTLTAVAISHAGLNRKTRYATLTVVAGANLPDIDLATRFWGSATYLKYHRGITHSILGVTVLALLLAWTVYALGRKAERRSGPPLARGWLLLAAWLGTASHLLLDFTNSYGIRPLLPFSSRWYAWDIMFIFDPLLLTLLVLGLGVPAILRLVSEEVGARSGGLRRGAVFSLCVLAALWGLRDLAHRRVLGQMEGHTYSQQDAQRLGAFPSPTNPFAWTGVVETDSSFHVLPANALENDVDPRSARVFHKPGPSPALEAARKTRTAAVFSDFARFPWAQVEEGEDGFAVTLRDLRFFSRLARRRGFVVEIELDKNLRVRSESFSFWTPARAGEP